MTAQYLILTDSLDNHLYQEWGASEKQWISVGRGNILSVKLHFFEANLLSEKFCFFGGPFYIFRECLLSFEHWDIGTHFPKILPEFFGNLIWPRHR